MALELVVIHRGDQITKEELVRYGMFPLRKYNITVPEQAKTVENLYARDERSKKLPIFFWEYSKLSMEPLIINEQNENCWEEEWPSPKDLLDGLFFALDLHITDMIIKKLSGG